MKYVYKLEDWICIIGLAAMIILGIVQVSVRYIFQVPFAGPDELSRMFQIIITYVGAAIAVREGSAISIDILKEILKKGIAPHILNLIVYSVGIVFAAIFSTYFYEFFTYSLGSNQTSIALGVPLAIPMGGMFLGLLFTFIHYVELLVLEVKTLRMGNFKGDEIN